MRSIGIIGGVGPGATSWLYLEIIKRCVDLGAPRYPLISVYSIPLDRRAELLFVNGVAGPAEEESVVEILAEAVRALSRQGVGLILVPCNTLHHYLDRIQQQAGADKAPMANMVYLASKQLVSGGRTMVLGTATMRNEELYGPFVSHFNKLVYPATEQQRVVQDLIQLCIKDPSYDPWPRLNDVLDKSRNAYDNVLVACTDLCVAGLPAQDVQAVGSLQSLATFAVDYVLGNAEALDSVPHQPLADAQNGLSRG